MFASADHQRPLVLAQTTLADRTHGDGDGFDDRGGFVIHPARYPPEHIVLEDNLFGIGSIAGHHAQHLSRIRMVNFAAREGGVIAVAEDGMD